MTLRAEAVVVGLGTAGSAALSFLARASVKAVGIDAYDPPHAMGSAHGETRMLRVAYSEGAAYVPMVHRSITLWRELESRTGNALYRQTGVVYAGPEGDAFLDAALSSAREHDVALAEISAAELRGPAVPSDWRCLLDRDAGYLEAEASIRAFLDDAKAHGATVIANSACRAIVPSVSGIVLETEHGHITADRVIVAVGAWAGRLVPALASLTHVERRVLHWFEDPSGRYGVTRGARPFLIRNEDGDGFYGFPANAKGEIKIAEHFKQDEVASPDAVDRTVSARDIDLIRPLARRFLPDLGAHVRSEICLYPMSKDEHFMIDRHPDDGRLILAAGLSGHGFKFAPAIGEALANFALDRPQAIDVGFFSLKRFAAR